MAGTTRPLPPGLLPSDEWLIQMLLEGRVDADIGGELGLSAGEVRERVALLASKLDVNGREGIRRYFGVERDGRGDESRRRVRPRLRLRWPRRRRHTLLWVAGAVALAAIGIVGALALTRGSGDSQAAAEATVSAQAAVSATAAAQMAAENPGGWYDAGPLFFVDGTTQPVVSISLRALYTVVTLAGPGLIKLDAGNVKWSGSNNGNLALTAMINGVWESVSLLGVNNTSLLVDSADVIRFFGINGNARPVLIVRVSPYHSNPANESFASADGRLFYNPKPVPDGAVINQDTGENLDMSQATALAVDFPVLGVPGAFTTCGGGLSDDDGGRCSVYWVGPLVAPADGTLQCGASGTWDLVTPRFVLHFAALTGLVMGPMPCSLAAPKPVRAGIDQIADNATSFVITATTNDPNLAPDNQNRLSVAIGGSRMYVGPIHLTVGCPCMGGS